MERGPLFIDRASGYEGHDQSGAQRGNDLEVNPLKEKQLTNIRTTSKTRPSA
jgi:GTP-binding protein